jgi:hypothetical protein
MATRKAQIQIQTTADTTGAKQAAAAMQGVAAASGTAEAGSKKVGQAAAQAGFQIQDFAVQVGAGTSALTAFSQQAPQLLGIFGPGGALAGALVAVGAVAAKIFLDIGKGAEDAKEQANEMADVLDNVAKAQKQIMLEDFDAGAEAVRISTEQAEQLRQALVNVQNAEAEYSRDAIANAETLRKTYEQLLILQGRQVDTFKSQQEAEKANAAARSAAAQQQIDAQQQLVDSAQAQVRAETEKFNQAQRAAEKKRQELDTAWQQLDALRQQRDELEKQAKIGAARTFPVFDAAGAQAMQAERARAAQGEQARAALADPRGIMAGITQLENTISAIEEFTGAQGKATQALSEAAANLHAAQVTLEATQAETQINIQGIIETFQAKEAQLGVQQISDLSKQQVEEIKTILETFTPVNEAQARNVEVMRAAAADGQILANEQRDVSAAAAALASQLRGEQTANKQLLEQLVQQSNLYTQQINTLTRQVQSLQSGRTTKLPAN